ncbi:MAG: Arylsulfatase [Opitutia bacterium UBA7350]|nr:MAG: Arylsulfatase [Opitutae bacterium UBA7350]
MFSKFFNIRLKPQLILRFISILLLGSAWGQAIDKNETERPNIVFIITDDQRYDEIAAVGRFPWMETPNLDKIVNEGVHFENAFVTTSLCGPSRASFLTGTYASRHGVIVNEHVDYDFELPTFPLLLQASGYRTGFIGKWHQAMHNRPRPGFDHWMCFWGQGKYFNDSFRMHEDQVHKMEKGKYLTDELNDLAVAFINEERPQGQPFMLYLSHKAPHQPFTPAPRHRELYRDFKIPSQDNPEDDLSTKPKYVRESAEKNRANPTGLARLHPLIPNKMRTLTAVDDGVGMIFEALKDKGILNNTIVIFVGDNGYFMSEHGGLHDKRKAYEASIRIPIVMWNPLVKQPQKIQNMVLNLDLAPSLLELAGLTVPEHMHGQSWNPLLKKDANGRKGFLYEYYKESDYRPRGGFPNTPTLHAYRTQDWKFVRYPDGDYKSELYHLAEDPDELYNLAQKTQYTDQVAAMAAKLDAQLKAIDYTPPVKIPGGGITHNQLYGN